MLHYHNELPAVEPAATTTAGQSVAALAHQREDAEPRSAAIRCVVAAETYKRTGRLPLWASAA